MGGVAGAAGGAASWMGGPWGLAAGAGLSLLPGLLGTMFGRGEDPALLRQRALAELDPGVIEGHANDFFHQTLGSPAFSMARSQMIQAGQTAAGSISRNLAQTGLGRTGVGNAMLGAASAAPDIHMGQLTSDAWSQAMQNAMGMAQARAGVYGNMPRQEGLGLPLTSAGLNAFLPFIFRLLQQQQQPGQQQHQGF
jgi:hypothetical protein